MKVTQEGSRPGNRFPWETPREQDEIHTSKGDAATPTLGEGGREGRKVSWWETGLKTDERCEVEGEKGR